MLDQQFHKPMKDLAVNAAFEFFKEMPLPAFILNRDQDLFLANPALARAFGYEDLTALEERLKKAEFLSFHFQSRDIAALYESLGQNAFLKSRPLRGQDLKGRELSLEITARARLHAPQGPADFMEAFFTFPGNALDAEAFLLKTRKESELAARAKNEFLSNINHELRTPLNIILGMLELAQEAEIDEDLKSNLALAKEAADNLFETLSDLISLSNLEARRLTCDVSQFSPHLLLRSLGDQFSAKVKNKGLTLNLVAPGCGETIMEAGYNLVVLAMEKVVDNAIKFSPENGQVTLETEISIEGGRPWLYCRVLDSGPGLDDYILQSEESFLQGDGSMNRKYGGLGLGLQLARKLAAALGGELSLSNRPEGGALVCLGLPVVMANNKL